VIGDDTLTIDGNAWRGTGAGHYTDGVTIARPAGATTISASSGTRATGGRLVLKGVAIRNGDVRRRRRRHRHDAADLTMSDSRVSGNRANNGSGIWSPARSR
jgi:hypothetical protein